MEQGGDGMSGVRFAFTGGSGTGWGIYELMWRGMTVVRGSW